ncbi:MAG: sensor histidine kinase, partial [Bacteroidales bacterium]
MDVSDLFSNPDRFAEVTNKFRNFYIKYQDLISKISIYDNQKNYYALFLESEDYIGSVHEFVVDSFATRRQEELSPVDEVELDGFNLEYRIPYRGQDMVIANVVIELDLNRFTKKVFGLFPLVSTISWQWILGEDGQLIINNFDTDSIGPADLQILTDSVSAATSGMLHHGIIGEKGKREKVYTAYYPVTLLGKKISMMYTAGRAHFFELYNSTSILMSIITQLLISALVTYLLILLARQKMQGKKLKLSETVLRQMIEHFPMGILVLDDRSIIRNINSAAQRMLFLGTASDLIGQDFSKQFLVSNRYLLSDGPSPFMDDSHYLYYEKDGMETVIYRSEKSANIGGEELRLIALIDVSALERSRKGEVAANKAKSDFLAAMSHEIRTPMNGILGMVNSLLEQKTNKEIHGKIEVVKRSAELLMTIINDILDFSKIEAGRMMLEEIPFNLTEEMELVGELFRPLAEEKGLNLFIDVRHDVPNKLIGDPFRLRQVISNLVSNAVKFTKKGKIVIGATLMESFKSHVNILFTVEDTGIGIPRDRLKEIFGSYTQARGSVQRKFGGTGLGTAISKQLVELMHGEIWVESPSTIQLDDEFPGSKFSFTIEAYSNERIPKKFDFSGISRLSEINVLILTKESEPERNYMVRILRKFGL